MKMLKKYWKKLISLNGIGCSLLCLMIGCHSPIKDGKVINKYLVPAHEEQLPDLTVPVEDVTITIPQGTTTVPDAWFVIIQNENKQGKIENRTVQVTKECYDRSQIGDWLTFKE